MKRFPPPPIVRARFEFHGAVLQSYDAEALEKIAAAEHEGSAR
jgi:hypothetical protein